MQVYILNTHAKATFQFYNKNALSNIVSPQCHLLCPLTIVMVLIEIPQKIRPRLEHASKLDFMMSPRLVRLRFSRRCTFCTTILSVKPPYIHPIRHIYGLDVDRTPGRTDQKSMLHLCHHYEIVYINEQCGAGRTFRTVYTIHNSKFI